MRAWLRQHRHAFTRALPRIGLLNAVVIGIALALPAGGYALLESVRAVAGRLAVEPQVAVFLDAKRANADALGATLKRDPRVARVRFVPREQALKELAAVQGMSELVRRARKRIHAMECRRGRGDPGRGPDRRVQRE